MSDSRERSALAFSLLMLLLGLSAGCTNMPGFLKGALSASPLPAASDGPVALESPEPSEIEGYVGNGTAPAQAATTATVHLSGFAFSPSQVTVAKGGTVTFINDDVAPHSVVPASGAQFTGSPVFDPGAQVTVTFAQAGEQPYACGLHPGMTGKVTVQEP